MLLNLASDKPFIYDNSFIFFDRKNLEGQLPKFFYENKDKIKNLYVLTGPGYFSSTRIWIEVVNILLALQVINTAYYLNKLEFFNSLWFSDIYLFSGNKNKFIFLQENGLYEIVEKANLDYAKAFEQLFDLKLEKVIYYEDILKKYKKLSWKKADKNHLLKPFYIFEPIVSFKK